MPGKDPSFFGGKVTLRFRDFQRLNQIDAVVSGSLVFLSGDLCDKCLPVEREDRELVPRVETGMGVRISGSRIHRNVISWIKRHSFEIKAAMWKIKSGE
jgi:hypothetical protein